MSNKKFEKQYHNFLNSKEVEVDHANLWKELEPRLPKKKKRSILLFLSTIAIVLTYMTYDSFNNESLQNISTNYVHVNHAAKKNKDSMVLTPQENDKSLSTDIKKQATIKNRKENPNTSIDPANQSKTVKSHYNKINNSINKNQITNDKSYVLLEKNDTLLTTHKPLAKNDTIIKNTNRVTTNAKTDHQTLIDISYHERTKSTLKNTVNLNSIKHEIKFMREAFSLALNTKTSKIKSNNIEIGINSQFLLPNYVYSESKNLENYGLLLEEKLKLSKGYSASLDFSYQHHSGFNLGAGLSYSKLIEDFRLDNQVITTDSFYNELAYIINGQNVGAQQEKIITTTQNVYNRNTFSFVDFSPHVSYRLIEKLGLEIGLKTNILLHQKYSGSLIDKNGNLIKEGSIFDNRKVSKISLGYFARIAFPLKSNLTARINLNYNSRPVKSSEEFKLSSINNWGIGLGFGYQIK